MKTIYLIILTLSLFFNCKKSEIIVITGSETLNSTIAALGNDFTRNHQNFSFKVVGGGSEDGISNLKQNKTDIAAVSRFVSDEELQSLGKDLESLLIAYDGVAIVVHPSNPLTKINFEQVHSIFSGKFKNWKDVGGADNPIIPVIRNDHSGTVAFFKEHVLRKKDISSVEYEKFKNIDFPKEFKEFRDNVEMANFIKENPNSIGFMGMGNVKEQSSKVRALSFAREANDEFVVPNIENVLNRKYKLSRGLYLIYRTNTENKISMFTNFVLSEDGQKSIQNNGYLRSTLPEVEVKANQK